MIQDQHARMKDLHSSVKSKVASNMELEAADAAYVETANSDDVQGLAQMLVEMNAMVADLHSLLVDTGRKGRPPM